MDRIFALEVFIKIVECQGFSAAAWQMNSSPATLSKTINALEDDLGFKLFHRTTRHVDMTPQGRSYYPLAKEIIEKFNQSRRIVQDESPEPTGLIRIAAPSLLAHCLLVKPLNEFLIKYPKVSVELIHYGAAALVNSGEVDLAFSTYKIPGSKLNFKLLLSEPRKLIASEKYIQRRGIPTSIFDLTHHDCLVNTMLHPEGIWEFGKNKVQVNARLKSADSLYLIKAAVAGLGILWAPTFFVKNYLENETLQLLPVQYDEKLGDIYLCYPSLPKEDKVRLLAELLIHHIKQL